MKNRKGFVSNSSSSNYILATKGEVTRGKLLALFKIPEDSFLYSLAVELADFLLPYEGTTKLKTLEDVVEEYRWGRESDEEVLDEHKEIVRLIKAGWTVYEGSSSNEAGGISAWVCDESFDFETDDLILRKEAGY